MKIKYSIILFLLFILWIGGSNLNSFGASYDKRGEYTQSEEYKWIMGDDKSEYKSEKERAEEYQKKIFDGIKECKGKMEALAKKGDMMAEINSNLIKSILSKPNLLKDKKVWDITKTAARIVYQDCMNSTEEESSQENDVTEEPVAEPPKPVWTLTYQERCPSISTDSEKKTSEEDKGKMQNNIGCHTFKVSAGENIVSETLPGQKDLSNISAETTAKVLLLIVINKLLIGLWSLSTLVMVIWWGYMIIYSWQDELLSKWKSIFTAWIISLVIALSSYFIIAFVRYMLYN